MDSATFNNRQTITHRDSFIKQVQMVVKAYDLFLLSIAAAEDPAKTDFTEMLHFQKAMFLRLIEIQRARPDDSDFHRIPEGHLVQMTCGHRGQPNRIEEKRVSRLLRKSGFIPMLEDIVDKKAPAPLTEPKKQPKQGAPPNGIRPPSISSKPANPMP